MNQYSLYFSDLNVMNVSELAKLLTYCIPGFTLAWSVPFIYQLYHQSATCDPTAFSSEFTMFRCLALLLHSCLCHVKDNYVQTGTLFHLLISMFQEN